MDRVLTGRKAHLDRVVSYYRLTRPIGLKLPLPLSLLLPPLISLTSSPCWYLPLQTQAMT